MSFKKPLRAVPIQPGPRYRQQARKKRQMSVVHYLGGAAIVGSVVGAGSVVVRDGDMSQVKTVAVEAGLIRASTPQPGAYYRNCDAARAAGVAPLYIGEPGYRSKLDRDGDGVACEPYRRR